MDQLFDLLKVAILSVIEGITEFLPISSTGHLVLANEFISLEPASFSNAFSIIIQLGAILSVVALYWKRLNPWMSVDPAFSRKPARYEHWNTQTKVYYHITHVDSNTMQLWKRVLIALIPGAVLGFLFDDYIDAHFMNMPVVTATLLLYGIIMIVLEKWNAKRSGIRYESPVAFSYQTAFLIGLFQCLALVPGTSRSAATIIGAMVLGSSRVAAAEFSFFLAIPTMVGATGLKILKNLGHFTGWEWFLILVGFVLSFLVAYVVIKRFMAYIQKKDFQIFGVYRIFLAVVLILFMILGM